MLESGDQVDGRYVVDARIGVGGMAEVYRVKHVSLGSVHALKVLLLPHPGLRERFLREGRIQAQIRHPNVVAVTDVIEHRGKLGLLMEYVDHVSLQQLLEAQGALPLDQALTLFAYILSGMSAAHASGVLHRDIKPANILLANTAQGLVPKITDFGIAKVVMDGAAPGATRDGTMMGTPGYMAPEQVLNAADVDRRVDVFALGALLYTTLAGTPAFRPDSPEVFDDTIAGRYVPLDQAMPGLPAAVVAAVHKALTPDRDARFADCAELAAALFGDRPELLHLATHTLETPAAILSEGPLTLPVSSLSTLAPALTQAGVQATLEKPPEPSRPARARWALPAIALVAVLTGVALVTLRPSQPDGVTPPPVAPSETPVQVAPEAAPLSGEPAAPVPSGPTPTAPATAPESTPATAPRPTTGTTTAPSSTGSLTTASVPTTTPAVTPEPSAAPEAAPEAVATLIPAAAPLTAPPPTAPPEAAPVPRLVGTWTGTANRRPATLRFTSQSGTSLKAELQLTLGSTDRVVELSGQLNPSTGALRLEESGGEGMVLTGTLAGDALSGSYMRVGQSKALTWEVSR